MGASVPDSAKVIGSNLRYLRKASGLSLKDIANVLGVTHQQVLKYEQGRNRFPVEGLARLRAYYNVPYDIFFRDLEYSQAPEDFFAIDHLHAFKRLEQLRDKNLRTKIQRIIMILLGP